MCLYHICQISSWTKASTETASALVSQISTATYFTRGAKLGSTCTSLAFILTDFQNKSWVVGSCLSQCGFQYFSLQPNSSLLPTQEYLHLPDSLSQSNINFKTSLVWTLNRGRESDWTSVVNTRKRLDTDNASQLLELPREEEQILYKIWWLLLQFLHQHLTVKISLVNT